nr:hypothetical protein [uncultured Sphingosinicella sp.]
MKLTELLRSREIIHPSRLSSAILSNRELRLTVTGHPWWREDKWTGSEEQLVLVFRGVAGGSLDTGTILDFEEDEALEEFQVGALDEHEWACPAIYSVYCHAPLVDAFRLYALVEDYLWEAGVPTSAREFLNMDTGQLQRFQEITASTSYLVARGPEAIRQIVSDELMRQSVPHNVLTNSLPQADLLLVRLGGSHFFCEEAIAEFG